MAARVRARLTAADGRRFGLTVGTAFLVITVLAWWRGRVTAAAFLGLIAGGLLLASIVAPVFVARLERPWMRLAHGISLVTTPIVTATVYFGLLTPLALLRRLVAGNVLVHRESAGGFWKARAEGSRRSNLHRQF